MKARKICMIGDFAVGKTSLVARFVHASFGERYLTTVGVKVDTKLIALPSGDRLKLVIWDIAGKSEFAPIDTSYLRDAAGYLLVVDGTRPETLQSASGLQAEAERQLGPVPFSVLINKSDLAGQWSVGRDQLAALEARDWAVSRTSALSGEGVERAFGRLGARLAHRL
jgi:small GTP-binding protein